MPSRISYNNSKIVPAPLVTINKDYQLAGDGQKIGSIYTITLNGYILADKGSPNSSGVFHTGSGYPADEVIADESRLASILKKQEALRNLFSDDGLSFEIQSADGSAPTKCNPRVVSPLTFQEGIWYNLCQYTITLQCDTLIINGQASSDNFTYNIQAADESWSFETDEDRAGTIEFAPTYRLTHTISATGKRAFAAGILAQEAWQEARDWVTERLGIDNAFIQQPNVVDLPSYYKGYNHVRSTQTDELNGTYSVTESWILSSGIATESFDINIQRANGNPITSVNINGSINGFHQRDGSFNLVSGKIDSAEVKWTQVQPLIYSRASNYFGGYLNPIATDTTIGKNPINGIITYSYSYDNRPSNLVTNTISESISVSDSFDVDVFAMIPIIGRANGPVLQSINTKKERTKSLNMELVFDQSIAGSGSALSRFSTNHPLNLPTQSGEIQSIVDAIKPINPYQIFVSDQQQSWDGVGRYTLNISWVYEV